MCAMPTSWPIFARNLFVEGLSLASQLLLLSQAVLDTLAAARDD